MSGQAPLPRLFLDLRSGTSVPSPRSVDARRVSPGTRPKEEWVLHSEPLDVRTLGCSCGGWEESLSSTANLRSIGAAGVGRDWENRGSQTWVAVLGGFLRHTPYPSGNAVAQPNLSFAFGVPAVGRNDAAFRLVVRPDFSGGNKVPLALLLQVFGVKPLTLTTPTVGLQSSGRRRRPQHQTSRPDVLLRVVASGTILKPAGLPLSTALRISRVRQ